MTRGAAQRCASKSILEGKKSDYFHTLLGSKSITGDSKPKQANSFDSTRNERLELMGAGDWIRRRGASRRHGFRPHSQRG